MTERTCSIEGCKGEARRRGWCDKHYARWRATGDPRRTPTGRTHNPGAKCSIEGCAESSRKRGWCGKHYLRWRRNGSTDDGAQSWVLGARGHCVVCDEPVPEGIGFRRYCGRSCAVMAHRGRRDRMAACVGCGLEIDLTARHPSGRMRHANTARCDSCRPNPSLRRYVPALISRDGNACHICGVAVDVTLKHPDPLSASVDHVIPRAHGGSDDMANYALSHLRCNLVKNARLGFTLMT